MNKIKVKVWVSTDSGLPNKNIPVLCRLSLDEKNITSDSILFINDNNEWRTYDDCEISYAWKVVLWQTEVEVETPASNTSDIEKFLSAKEKEITLKNQQIELLELKITQLKFAGSALSNCCYNLSQQGGSILLQRDADSMKKAYDRWDLMSKK